MVDAPDLLQELAAGEKVPGLAGQELDELPFPGGQPMVAFSPPDPLVRDSSDRIVVRRERYADLDRLDA